jgi:hypothetical protein
MCCYWYLPYPLGHCLYSQIVRRINASLQYSNTFYKVFYTILSIPFSCFHVSSVSIITYAFHQNSDFTNRVRFLRFGHLTIERTTTHGHFHLSVCYKQDCAARLVCATFILVATVTYLSDSDFELFLLLIFKFIPLAITIGRIQSTSVVSHYTCLFTVHRQTPPCVSCSSYPTTTAHESTSFASTIAHIPTVPEPLRHIKSIYLKRVAWTAQSVWPKMVIRWIQI